VPTEAYLTAVETLPLEQVRDLARAGRDDARIQLARLLWWNGDMREPLVLLREPAASGVPVAQYLLATYLMSREPGPAMELLKNSASGGHAIAQETLASYYASGTRGLPRSPDEAFKLYLKAGLQGLRNAQMNVGMMLCKGTGTEANKAAGRKWFASSQQGQMMPLPPRAAGCDDA
jgi:TPR repeat protein